MKLKWIVLLGFLFTFWGVTAQENFKLDALNSQIIVGGTSSLHDWQMQASDFSADLTITLLEGKAILTRVDFMCVAESLKSDNNMMDKKAHEALKTNNHKHIRFRINEKPVFPVVGQAVKNGRVPGELFIAGVKKPVAVISSAHFDKDGNVKVEGKATIKMSDYGIKPPVALMGALKTGDEINIEYSLFFIKLDAVAITNK